jgi:hypothetical protein
MEKQREIERMLETAIDSSDLHFVVTVLAVVCLNKKEHILTNWQDKATADPWGRASIRIAQCGDTIRKLGI